MQPRRIAKAFASRPVVEGAGVHLKRAFGSAQVPLFDPFLMLDDFHTDNPEHYLAGFPWHPHRGIETITYVLEGLVEHGDSMGNKGAIRSGEVQWMTAGGGVIHQEMPQRTPTDRLWGFQLWANLPAARKMIPPRYRDVKAAEIPEIALDSGARVKIICGEVAGTRGPVRDIVIDPEFLDVAVPAGGVFRHPVKPGHTAVAYVLEGRGLFDDLKDGPAFGPETALLYERAGEAVAITALDGPLRFLLIGGKPLGEPVAWGGPIVMNTQEELRQAFDELDRGVFVRHP